MTVKKVTASAKTSRNEFGEKMYYGNLSVLCSMYYLAATAKNKYVYKI